MLKILNLLTSYLDNKMVNIRCSHIIVSKVFLFSKFRFFLHFGHADFSFNVRYIHTFVYLF